MINDNGCNIGWWNLNGEQEKSPSHDWVYIFQMEFNGVDLMKNSGIGEHIMELLPDGQRNTATEVSWDDQQKINKFSTLINKKDENLEVLKKLKEEKEYLDDLSLEIELLDEDEKIQYKVGEVFIFMKVNKVIEKIEVDNEVLTEKISNIESSVDEIDDLLESYKKQLYARFGNNINLER